MDQFTIKMVPILLILYHRPSKCLPYIVHCCYWAWWFSVLTGPAFAEFHKPPAPIYHQPPFEKHHRSINHLPTPVHIPPEVEKPKPPTLPPRVVRPPPKDKPLPPIVVKPPPQHKPSPPYGHYPGQPPLDNVEIPYKSSPKVIPPPSPKPYKKLPTPHKPPYNMLPSPIHN